MGSRARPLGRCTRGQRVALTTAALLGLASGCFGNERTEFPPGLEPLEDSTAPAPEPRDGDAYPEELVTVTGDTRRHDWAHSRGFVAAPLRDVYRCLQVPDVVVDRREVDRYSVTLDTEPEYEVSFRVRNEVDDVITVEFDLSWRMGVVEGTPEDPRLIAVTFQKTWGTTFITIMEGSFLARQVNDEVTEIEMVEHINAAMGGSAPIASYQGDVFRSLVAHTNGEPLPTY